MVNTLLLEIFVCQINLHLSIYSNLSVYLNKDKQLLTNQVCFMHCKYLKLQLLIIRFSMKNKILLATVLLGSSSMAIAGTVVDVPEPSMLPLLAIGVAALIINKLRKK
jgi:hypothetical protein